MPNKNPKAAIVNLLGEIAKATEPADEKSLSKVEGSPTKKESTLMEEHHEITPHSTKEAIILINTEDVINWKYHDRLEGDLGDINELANDILVNGQIQPCVVRTVNSPYKNKYELIIGERRWRAAKQAGVKLKVVVKDLTDSEAAIKQFSENNRRKDISDYALGMNLNELIKDKIISAKELEKKLNISKSQVDRYLSFSQVPKDVWDAIEDPSKISARTAAEIRALTNKGNKEKEAIIALAGKIKAKKISARNLKDEVYKFIGHSTKRESKAEEIISQNGRHLFTWRKDSNSNISISFPKGIRKLIDKKRLENCIRKEIEDQIKTIG